MKCKNCDKESPDINNRKKYCSEKCKKEYQKNHPKIYNYTCRFCGNEFESKNKRRGKFNYCSFECSTKHKKEIKSLENKMVCEWCGEDFIRKRAEQRFCSVNCVNKWQQTRIGEKSSNFNFGISWEDRKIICKNCEKEFYVIPSEINKRKFVVKNVAMIGV